MSASRCGACGIAGTRLYRPYGEFRRPERDRCNGCIRGHEREFYVPLCLAEDGYAWGYTSVPPDAAESFGRLREADLRAAGWDMAESRWERLPCGSGGAS